MCAVCWPQVGGMIGAKSVHRQSAPYDFWLPAFHATVPIESSSTLHCYMMLHQYEHEPAQTVIRLNWFNKQNPSCFRFKRSLLLLQVTSAFAWMCRQRMCVSASMLPESGQLRLSNQISLVVCHRSGPFRGKPTWRFINQEPCQPCCAYVFQNLPESVDEILYLGLAMILWAVFVWKQSETIIKWMVLGLQDLQ